MLRTYYYNSLEPTSLLNFNILNNKVKIVIYLGLRFSGVWTESSDGSQFKCTVTPKNKLECISIQEDDVNIGSTETISNKQKSVYTVNISKSSITDDGKSNLKGIYHHRGYIIWQRNNDKNVWIKGKFYKFSKLFHFTPVSSLDSVYHNIVFFVKY